jgi:hypothetical protein
MRQAAAVVAGIIGLFACAAGGPAQAQSYVASNGNDSSSCARSAPCLTLQGAYNKTTIAGETITCLDAGPFSDVTISKSITIDCRSTKGAADAVRVSGTAPTDVVIVRGLSFNGLSFFGGPPAAVILFNGAGTLRLEEVSVLNAAAVTPSAYGVAFVPTGTAKLHVSDSLIANNGGSGTTAGILIKPSSGIAATVAIERTVVENNLFGIFADGTAGGAIRGAVADSFVSGNVDNGISVNTSGANVSLMIDNTKVSGNNYGLAVAGTGGLLLVRRSTITANNNGVATFSGGQAVSYRDNAVNNNTVDGAFSFAIGTQ